MVGDRGGEDSIDWIIDTEILSYNPTPLVEYIEYWRVLFKCSRMWRNMIPVCDCHHTPICLSFDKIR